MPIDAITQPVLASDEDPHGSLPCLGLLATELPPPQSIYTLPKNVGLFLSPPAFVISKLHSPRADQPPFTSTAGVPAILKQQ